MKIYSSPLHDAQFTHAHEVYLLIYSGNSNHSMQLERCLKKKKLLFIYLVYISDFLFVRCNILVSKYRNFK